MNYSTSVLDIHVNETTRILSYLSIQDIVHLRQTCSTLDERARDPHLGLILLRRDFKVHYGGWNEYKEQYQIRRDQLSDELYQAANTGSLNRSKELINDGAKINHVSRSYNNETPLIVAVKQNHNAVVRLLLSKGADPNRCDFKGNAPLVYAAHNGNNAIVKGLLKAGAQPSDDNTADEQPLHLAADQGHVRVVRTLLEAGADWSLLDGCSRNALYFAHAIRDRDIVQVLSSYMRDTNLGQ